MAFISLSFFVNQGEQRIYINNGRKKLAIGGDHPMYIEVFRRHLWKTKSCLSGGNYPEQETLIKNKEINVSR